MGQDNSSKFPKETLLNFNSNFNYSKKGAKARLFFTCLQIPRALAAIQSTITQSFHDSMKRDVAAPIEHFTWLHGRSVQETANICRTKFRIVVSFYTLKGTMATTAHGVRRFRVQGLDFNEARKFESDPVGIREF